jgi:hypothetical protein
MAGLKANITHGWKILRQGLHIESEQRITNTGAVYVGCKHIVNLVKLPSGTIVTTMTYDMEVYSAAQERWLEVSSVSNFESFQSNRMKIRTKDENGKTQLLHTLNGSSLALPRILAS